ncbi:hypothetical protein QJQ45_021960 [Haematococcus lacustris]|nr:hypothetical protein QJQ45_021960 [Haematococcus lacustris]
MPVSQAGNMRALRPPAPVPSPEASYEKADSREVLAQLFGPNTNAYVRAPVEPDTLFPIRPGMCSRAQTAHPKALHYHLALVACDVRPHWATSLSSTLLSIFSSQASPTTVTIAWCHHRPDSPASLPSLFHNFRHNKHINVFFIPKSMPLHSNSAYYAALTAPGTMGCPELPLVVAEEDVTFAPGFNRQVSSAYKSALTLAGSEPFVLNLYRPSPVEQLDIVMQRLRNIQNRSGLFEDSWQSLPKEIPLASVQTGQRPVPGYQDIIILNLVHHRARCYGLVSVAGNTTTQPCHVMRTQSGPNQTPVRALALLVLLLLVLVLMLLWRLPLCSVNKSLIQHTGTASALFGNKSTRFHVAEDFPVVHKFAIEDPEGTWGTGTDAASGSNLGLESCGEGKSVRLLALYTVDKGLLELVTSMICAVLYQERMMRFVSASGSGQQEVVGERRQVIKAAIRGLVEAARPDLSPAQVDAVVAEMNKRMTMGSKQCCLTAVISPRSAAAPAQLPPPVPLNIWDPKLLAQIKDAMELLTTARVLEHLMRGPHHSGIKLLPVEVAVFEQPSSSWPVAKLKELDDMHLTGDGNSLNANATTISTSIGEFYRHPGRFIKWWGKAIGVVEGGFSRNAQKHFPQLVLGRLDYSLPDRERKWRLVPCSLRLAPC